jgi:hypothetical protein
MGFLILKIFKLILKIKNTIQMKKTLFFTLLILISCNKTIESNPDHKLSKVEQENFKSKIVRFYESLPKDAHNKNTLDTTYIKYYERKAKESDLLHYYKNENNEIYFAVAKIAPSLKLKKVATIGKMKLNDKDSIIFYQEIARTWKMEIPELKEKTKTLFDLIVQEKSVEKYYTKNSNPEFWIEFPDDFTTYDTINRNWLTKK